MGNQDGSILSNVDLSGYKTTDVSFEWADYADTQYTEGSPFSIVADTDTLLPNNGLGGVKTYEPDGITLYNTSTQKITGIEGENRTITLEFKAKPTAGATTYLEHWIDIGGVIPPLYTRIVSFPKGVGVERNITSTTMVYTLDTWEANGGSVYIRANGSADIYGIRYVIKRV